MSEQLGTPGSNADTSVNGGRAGAPKDKQCPFCNQHFTSSSLGRHLDLYIKERNPKPADGMHDVDEIRKMRGGITRRQPRNSTSTSRREDSTPAGTPGGNERRSPGLESDMPRSPSLRRDPIEGHYFVNKPNFTLNKGTLESTGVMNNIPILRNGNSVRSFDGEERESGRREPRNRSVSKQMLTKTSLDQKQKMADALDNARAAELALRELLGGIRAAKQRIEGPSIFNYDPMALDFPSLTLHCLPPPPTLSQSHPLPTSASWSILPPSDTQYEALRTHFSSAIHNWRLSCAIATTAPREDFSYPPSELFNPPDDPSEIAERAEAVALDLESKISAHLHQAFGYWNSLSTQRQAELWTLELARSVGRKSEEVQTLKKKNELISQEAAHLRIQVDDLSRLQHPREFKLLAPTTVPIESSVMSDMTESGLNQSSIGFSIMDRSLHLDAVVDKVIGRWKGVVKEARGANSGLTAQRSLSGEPVSTAHMSEFQSRRPIAPNNTTPPQNSNQSQNHTHTQKQAQNHNGSLNQIQNDNQKHTTPSTIPNGADMGSDPDADADADMEEDDYIDLSNGSHPTRPPDGANFCLTNGNSQSIPMDGLENANCVQGYVRIGA